VNRMVQLAFRDLMCGLFAVFFLFFLVPHKPDEAKSMEGLVAPHGEIVIGIAWDPINVDVDLWVQSPGENPIGYSNAGSRNCNLLRDDLGMSPEVDPLPVNFERTVCRMAEPGEWLVGVHYYGGQYEEDLQVHAVIRKYTGADNVKGQVVIDKTVVLARKGDEATVLHFFITPNGYVDKIPGDKHFGLAKENRPGMH